MSRRDDKCAWDILIMYKGASKKLDAYYQISASFKEGDYNINSVCVEAIFIPFS